MRPEHGDEAYLWDMREAAREAVEFVRDLDLAGFIEDRRVLLAVERELEIIGEAARRVSASLRDSHPRYRGSRSSASATYSPIIMVK